MKNPNQKKVTKEELHKKGKEYVQGLVTEALTLANTNEGIEFLLSKKTELASYKEYPEYALLKFYDALREEEKYDEAFIVSSYLYEHFPKYTTGQYAYARSFEDQGHKKHAIEIIKKIKNFRGREDTYYAYCTLLGNNNNFELALPEFAKFLEAFPHKANEPQILYHYAILLAGNKQPYKAKEILELLFKLEPKYWKAYLAYGFILLHDIVAVGEAIEAQKKALEVMKYNIPYAPTDIDKAKIYLQLGIAYQELLDDKNAADNYTEALKLDPNCKADHALKKLIDTDYLWRITSDRIPHYHHRGRAKFIPFKVKPDEPLKKSSEKNPNSSKEYVKKHEELNNLCQTYETEFGEEFNEWFEKTYKDASDKRGALSIAEDQAKSGIYAPAIKTIKKVLKELPDLVKKENFSKVAAVILEEPNPEIKSDKLETFEGNSGTPLTEKLQQTISVADSNTDIQEEIKPDKLEISEGNSGNPPELTMAPPPSTVDSIKRRDVEIFLIEKTAVYRENNFKFKPKQSKTGIFSWLTDCCPWLFFKKIPVEQQTASKNSHKKTKNKMPKLKRK